VGQVGSTGCNLSGSALANFGTFAAGSWIAEANNIIASIHAQQVFSAWREIDPSGYLMVQLTGYTGNGTGARIINLPHITGRWPLLAMIAPGTAASVFRDPSHAGNNSSTLTTSSIITDGIIGGGPDLLLVGNGLNQNLVIYDVFVIMGDTAGWNNGIFSPPTIITPGTWNEPGYNPSDLPIITGDGGMNFNGEAPLLAVKDLSGIYTLVPGKRNDTLYTGIADDTVDVKVPNPLYKTGYIGG
jgi:hypothetical protein